ncbi:MAG: phosphoenolpyruvate--protein phosphotransferase [Lentisphaerae bacterium]|nr:phosphoenolpyruvate--protein phosphotransferase [Lentisphaerota bacterium]
MREEKLQLVSDVCELIAHASESDLNKTLMQIVKLIGEALHAKVVLICLQEDAYTPLRLVADYGLYFSERQSFTTQKTITEAAFQRQKTINIPFCSPYASRSTIPTTLLARINSLLVVPLLACGKAIGTLSIGRTSKQVFPGKMVSICESLATPLATFCQNILLTQQINAVQAEAANEQSHSGTGETSDNGVRMFRGRPVVPGVSSGSAMVLAPLESLEILELQKSNNPSGERELLREAIQEVKTSLKKITAEVENILTEADVSIFAIYQQLLEDVTLHEMINKYLQANYSLDSSLSLTFKDLSDTYEKIEDEYLRERLFDIKDVLLRLKNAAASIRNGQQSQDRLTEEKPSRPERKIILVARELLPTQLIASPLKNVNGIVCESGGQTSHAAILAKALRIPMLIGIKELPDIVRSGDKILLDCQAGLCYLHPTTELIKQYAQPLVQSRKMRVSALPVDDCPVDDSPRTQDGAVVHLSGNITLFSELPTLHSMGVRNIGLYRTEFMFMIRNNMPDEDEQVRIISRLVKAAKGSPVTIRALDIGGDKPLPYVDWGQEANPSLGWRGLRFLLSNPAFMHTQLRAILRTTVLGPVNLLFPMVADKQDLLLAQQALLEAKHSLLKDGLPFADNCPVGIMLEVPSAVFSLDKLLPEVDFISIGTNDLVQYLFAVDRGNARVNHWFRQTHPIVLRILRQLCREVARFPGKRLSLCGELAGMARALPLLLGAGLRELSMNANSIPAVRDYVGKLNIDECESLWEKASNCDSDTEVQRLLDEMMHQKVMSQYPST